MRKLAQVLIVSAIVLLSGCSEESTTAPEEDGNYNLETTETIGTTGGTVEIDDFKLSIPAGSFDADQTIEIYASTDDQPFGDDQVTRSFRLEGLPAQYAQPIRVGIKYEGLLSDETYVARGAQVFEYANGDTTTVYRLHAATDSSGYLVADIPATQGGAYRLPSGSYLPNATADGAADALELLGLTGYGTRQTDHFAIHYPQDLVSVSIPSVGTMLEEIYAGVKDTLQLPWLWVSPLQTVITDIGTDRGAYGGFAEDIAGPVLNLSRSHLSNGNFTPVRIDIGQWLLGYVLGTFDQNSVDPAQYWLWNAVVTWAEEVFTDDLGYQRPSDFPDNEMAPFNGLRAGAGNNAADVERSINHGRGISTVIEFLVNDNRFGKAGIEGTYETIWTGSSATYALLNNVNALVTEWWPEFFKSYVGGEIYGVESNVFTNDQNLAGTWTIDDENDTEETFTFDYPDLSAKLFEINLDYDSIDPVASLALDLTTELTTPISVMVFGVDGDHLEYWNHSTAQGTTSLLITDVRDLYDAGWRHLIVVVVNCNVSDTYLEASNIDLKMQMSSEIEPVGLDYTNCELSLRHFRGYYWKDYFDPSEEDYQYFDSWIDYYSETAEGSFTGGTFTGSFDFTDDYDNHYSGSVQARVVGDPPNRLVFIDFHQVEEDPYHTRKTRIRAENIDYSSGLTWMSFDISGRTACDYVETFSDTLIYSDHQDTLITWDCLHAEQIPSIGITFR